MVLTAQKWKSYTDLGVAAIIVALGSYSDVMAASPWLYGVVCASLVSTIGSCCMWFKGGNSASGTDTAPARAERWLGNGPFVVWAGPVAFLVCLWLVFVSAYTLSAARVLVLLASLYVNEAGLYPVAALVADLYFVGVGFAGFMAYLAVFLAYYLYTAFWVQLHTGVSGLGLVASTSAFLVTYDSDLAIGKVVVNLALVALMSLVVWRSWDPTLSSVVHRGTILPISLVASAYLIALDYIDDRGTDFWLGNVVLCFFTTVSVPTTWGWSILTQLRTHSDTKAIFQFLMLNSAFMVVQLVYSFRSGSLGLFSDSLHMALDCSSLALGLVAGVLSKTPVDPNSKYPFGYGSFETLAGFTNGTLLVGISGGIIFEAVTRLYNPIELQKTTELIVVSVLGLVVNLVGIFAFNHGHAHGHGHGHSHSHGPDHSEHKHGHDHGSSHTHSHGECTSHGDESPSHGTESHTLSNDNMRGIFLHILADTLGSVGVVISTVLTKMFKWEGFDPIASIIIAVLIFLSAIPLIKSTGSSLLLSLPKEKESQIRNILKDLATIKGLKSFTTPRFWPQQDSVVGYIHIQIYRGENSGSIKKQVQRCFGDVEVMVQMEYDYEDCWCRKKA